jgi:hypothetical protein
VRAWRGGAAGVSARPLTWWAPDQGLRLVDNRAMASHNATGVFAGNQAIAGYRLTAIKVPPGAQRNEPTACEAAASEGRLERSER